ncbi:hypothetical protein Tco_0920660 [Tanacetum coccineum]
MGRGKDTPYFLDGYGVLVVRNLEQYLEISSFKLKMRSVPGQDGVRGTDIANITGKRSKPDKHGHENGKSAQEPGV